MNIAILGAMWGDEGKGHITHHLSKDYDWVIRFGGGANAGHTIYRDGKKYVHNLLPSFDWRSSRPQAFLGAGMVIDLPQLHSEVSRLKEEDPSLPSRVFVDPDAFLVLEEHQKEDRKTNGHIGSTNRGIGPAYKSKVERRGLRVRDALNGSVGDSWTDLAVPKLKELGVQFRGALELKSIMENQSLLFEGAQGILLDINHGIYPYVSCGDATIGGIIASGFAFAQLERVFGVAKCYTTKVGEGPFPTELQGKDADDLRTLGNEYGATTGRPRRVGWLDLPALKYACQKGGITDLILTKFDVLSGLEQVPLCVSYPKPPVCSSDFFSAQPQYVRVKGWQNAKDLPQLVPFVKLVEQGTESSVKYVSCGTGERDILSYKLWWDEVQ